MKRLLLIALLLPSLLLAQHTIKGVFSPAKDFNFALLYKVTPTLSDYVSNAEIQEDGSFEFKLDSTNTKGMYRLVYAVPQEDYNFDIIYNGKEDIELIFNSETGVEFIKSSENKLLIYVLTGSTFFGIYGLLAFTKANALVSLAAFSKFA